MTTGAENTYTKTPLEKRANDPLHASVRELVGRFSVNNSILDLGCSDGASTFGLENSKVIGVDLNQSALELASQSTPNHQTIHADIKHLPITPEQLSETDIILMIDVLEHEKWADSVAILNKLRQLMPHNHTLITSIPIISPLSIDSWLEGIKAILNRARPDEGLFDSTHKILAGRHKHLKLLSDGGYELVQEYQTNHIEGVTGDWNWKSPDRKSFEERLLDSGKSRQTVALARAAVTLYNKLSESEHPCIRNLGKGLFAYQGIYVASPK